MQKLVKIFFFASSFEQQKVNFLKIIFAAQYCLPKKKIDQVLAQNLGKNQKRIFSFKMVTETEKIKKTKSVQDQILLYMTF